MGVFGGSTGVKVPVFSTAACTDDSFCLITTTAQTSPITRQTAQHVAIFPDELLGMAVCGNSAEQAQQVGYAPKGNGRGDPLARIGRTGRLWDDPHQKPDERGQADEWEQPSGPTALAIQADHATGFTANEQ